MPAALQVRRPGSVSGAENRRGPELVNLHTHKHTHAHIQLHLGLQQCHICLTADLRMIRDWILGRTPTHTIMSSDGYRIYIIISCGWDSVTICVVFPGGIRSNYCRRDKPMRAHTHTHKGTSMHAEKGAVISVNYKETDTNTNRQQQASTH